MKAILFEEQKAIMLEILSYLDSVCAELCLSYSLGCGSVLGAVRHQGMIPWDDDIDVFMMRDDYERLKKEYDNGHEYYKLRSYNIDGYPIPYAKLSDERTYQIEELGSRFPSIGINIDIFPIDNVSGDFELFKKQKEYRLSLYNKLFVVYFPFFTKHSPKGYFDIVYHKFRYGKGLSLCKEIDKLAQTAAPKDSGYVYEQIMGVFGKRPFRKEWFDSFVRLPFEGKEYPVMKGYREYLEAHYGENYMELPSVEKRHRHESRAFVK